MFSESSQPTYKIHVRSAPTGTPGLRVVGKIHPGPPSATQTLVRGQASHADDAADAEDGRPARTRERALPRRHGGCDDEHAHRAQYAAGHATGPTPHPA